MDDQPVETTLYSLTDSAPEEPGQRRTSDRHLSLLRVGALVVGDRRELCLIRNVSAGGMMIRAYSRIETGTVVEIELKQGSMVRGTVRWTKEDTVGVEFDEPIDVISLISTSDDGPRPRMPRIEIEATAWVREDGTVYRAKAVNISQGGLKILARNELPVGADVTVSLHGLVPIAGTIRWEHEGAYGITFNHPLGLPTLVNWLQGQRSRQNDASARRAG